MSEAAAVYTEIVGTHTKIGELLQEYAISDRTYQMICTAVLGPEPSPTTTGWLEENKKVYRALQEYIGAMSEFEKIIRQQLK